VSLEENPPITPQLQWHRSQRCFSETCVEVAISGDKAFVWDSKDCTSAFLVFDAEEWSAFLAGAQDHEFDLD
jgi:hypothetical protein